MAKVKQIALLCIFEKSIAMDLSLSKEQIAQLITFLESRKFKDPVVMAEVLHNLEDKIALKLSSDPALHVDDAIRQVCDEMEQEDITLRQEMHMPGYTPIPVIYEKVVKKKYKHILRGELKKLLTDPLYLVGGIALAIACYFLYRWGNTHAVIWGDMNGVSLLLIIAYLVATFWFFGKVVDVKVSSVQMNNDISGFPLILSLIIFQHSHPAASVGLTVMSVLFGLVCGIFFFNAIARYRTLVTARKNSDEVYSFYGNKFPWLKAV